MKQTIKAGAEFEYTDPRETRQIMTEVVKEFFTEEARGITIWRDDREVDVASTDVTIPVQGDEPFGTNPGFAILVQYARTAGLASGDILKIYRNVVTDKNFLGQLTFADPVIKFGGKGLILKGGEHLVFSGAGLTATSVSVNAEGIEIPEVDLYKMVAG